MGIHYNWGNNCFSLKTSKKGQNLLILSFAKSKITFQASVPVVAKDTCAAAYDPSNKVSITDNQVIHWKYKFLWLLMKNVTLRFVLVLAKLILVLVILVAQCCPISLEGMQSLASLPLGLSVVTLPTQVSTPELTSSLTGFLQKHLKSLTIYWSFKETRHLIIK